ncbi:MAG: hypothetical protein ACD_73C00285G0004 [uncultured bacterium]|nr:MAG: hypothetical protein ACD_73C00285G0004 [uncultured bacterium]
MLMKDIVFFGGAFDPPHLGHLAVLQFLETISRFDEVWVVPSFFHPYAKKMISYDHRIKMCELMLPYLSSKVLVSDIERQWGQHPCYTLDVIRYAKKKDPLQNFWLVVGSDCQKDLPGWYQYEKLKNEVNFFFLPRPGFKQSPFPNISSTVVRECLAKRNGMDNLVTKEILDYIIQNRLYC